jgi:predicted transposase/invertase (TIGR01784 family)
MLKESKINGGEIMQTLAQQLREEGIKIGEKNMQTLAEQLKQEGIKIGIEENAKETAKRMLKKGLDMDTIVEITGLKPSEIEKLREVSN